jgi:hypothetical protein
VSKIATFKAHPLFGTKLTLYSDRIDNGKESHSLTGVTAEIESFTGALNAGHGAHMNISGPEFAWTFTIESVKTSRAYKFVNAVRLAARKLSPAL